MKNGQKSSLYGEVSPYSEEIPYSERFSQIHYREYPLYCQNLNLRPNLVNLEVFKTLYLYGMNFKSLD